MWKARYMKVISQAAQTSGGYERLARRLGVAEQELASWARGIGTPAPLVCEKLALLLRKNAIQAARATLLTRRDAPLAANEDARPVRQRGAGRR
jgi:transcriptional regulator with XRE-family HTH domain